MHILKDTDFEIEKREFVAIIRLFNAQAIIEQGIKAIIATCFSSSSTHDFGLFKNSKTCFLESVKLLVYKGLYRNR